MFKLVPVSPGKAAKVCPAKLVIICIWRRAGEWIGIPSGHANYAGARHEAMSEKQLAALGKRVFGIALPAE